MKEGWTYKRFDAVFDLQMGKTPDRKNPQYFEGPNVWVSIRDLTTKEICDSNEHISDTAVDVTNIHKVKKGTVIMSFKLTVGKCAIAARDLYTNEAIMAFNLRGGYDISSDFLFYYLSNYKWEGANKAVMGITLNKATISRHKIGYPSSSKQKIIVSELDKINELISLKKSQLKGLDILAQSIFYEMFGDPITNEKGWEVKKLGDVCDATSSKRIFAGEYTESGIPFYRGKEITELSKNLPISIELYISKERYLEIKKDFGIPMPNDILITAVGTIGNIWIVENTQPFYFKDGNIIWLRKIDKQICSIFFKTILTNLLEAYKQEMARGAAYSALTIVNLKRMNIPLPPLSLQHQFAERVESIDRMKQKVQTAIKDLESLLASRMDYWFND